MGNAFRISPRNELDTRQMTPTIVARGLWNPVMCKLVLVDAHKAGPALHRCDPH